MAFFGSKSAHLAKIRRFLPEDVQKVENFEKFENFENFEKFEKKRAAKI